MVTQLRKIGTWIWLNKERMFLAALVAVLCYRVYLVVYPPAPEAEVFASVPKDPEDLDPQTLEEITPGNPPVAPPPLIRETWRTLQVRNPFTYYSAEGGSGTGQEQEVEMALLDIQVLPNGKERAKIRTASTTKWYTEGEKFEQFELLEIDPDAQTAVVYSEQLAKRLDLKIGQ
ncbi:MAG: hypothetical protein IT368_04170 [Candidatus Hydrogenedentes bacterium]|nr:hypothetical protein [Candidatus Hydrogenedentota bacterium]